MANWLLRLPFAIARIWYCLAPKTTVFMQLISGQAAFAGLFRPMHPSIHHLLWNIIMSFLAATTGTFMLCVWVRVARHGKRLWPQRFAFVRQLQASASCLERKLANFCP